MLITETNMLLKRQITDAFVSCSVGEIITFDSLSNAVGFDIRSRRHIIVASRRLANEETGALFSSVRGEGYLRIATEQASALGRSARSHIRKTATRASKQMVNAIIKANDVSDEDRAHVNREQSMLGLIAHLTLERSVHPLKEGAPPPPSANTIRATIEAMKHALS